MITKAKNTTYHFGKTFALIFVTALLCSFSPPQQNVEGYPIVYGHEPFSFIGIETLPQKDDELPKHYRIVCSAEEEAALREKQGFVVQIRGRIVPADKAFDEYGPDILSDGVIVLSSWK